MLIFNIIDGHLKLNNHYYLKIKNTIMTSSLMLKYNIVCVNPRWMYHHDILFSAN
jgi:hypothetical protein